MLTSTSSDKPKLPKTLISTLDGWLNNLSNRTISTLQGFTHALYNVDLNFQFR